MISQPRNLIARAVGRITQGFVYLAPRRADVLDAELRRLLNAAEFDLVSQLAAADRAHLLAVYQRLQQLGCQDADVLRAGLLHDVGKVDGAIRVGLVHRTVAVLLNATAPALLDRLAIPGAGHWRRAFQLVKAHPSLGAQRARDAGCNERVCWLIEHHHDAIAGGDAGLQLLQRADEG
jgi:hypothetical protein